MSRGEFICNLSKTKDDGKDRKLEKEAGNVGGKKEKEKPDIAAQLCGNNRNCNIITLIL